MASQTAPETEDGTYPTGEKKKKRERETFSLGPAPPRVKAKSYDFGDTNTSASKKEDSIKRVYGPRRTKLTA